MNGLRNKVYQCWLVCTGPVYNDFFIPWLQFNKRKKNILCINKECVHSEIWCPSGIALPTAYTKILIEITDSDVKPLIKISHVIFYV